MKIKINFNDLEEMIKRDLSLYESISVKQKYAYIEKYYEIYDVSIRDLVSIFGVSKSGYFYYLSHKDYKYNKDKQIIEKISQIQNNPDIEFTYGVKKMKITLEKDCKGLLPNGTISCGKVRRLMKENKLEFRDSSLSNHGFHGNIYSRCTDIHIAKYIGDKLGTDISEKKALDNRKLYITIVQDSASSYLLSWNISTRINCNIMDKTLVQAIKNLNNIKANIIHSDQGTIYSSKEYKESCDKLGLTPSMSRKATPTDNGQVENVFSCLVKERLSRHTYKNVEELKNAVEGYFNFYNNKRIHLRLKMTPKEYLNLHSKDNKK